MQKKIFTVIGATVAASLCCVTPVLAVLAGSSTLASSFSWLAPYHNYLVAFTVLVLVYAWWDKLKASKEMECNCDEKSGFFSSKKFLFVVTAFSLIMLSFPLWGNNFFTSVPTAQSCSTGACDSSKAHVENQIKEIDINSLPVFKYMNQEIKNPTPYKQVACSGSGYKSLDILMAQKRKEIEEMPPPVLLKMLDEGDDVILVDIREPQHQDGHYISAMESYDMPYGQVYFSAFKKLQDKNNIVVVYGKFGMVSLFVASTLKKLGFKNVYSLKGGFDAWKLAGYPIEKKE